MATFVLVPGGWYTTEAFRQLFLDGAAADGFSVQPPPGLDPRATAHPLASFLPRLTLSGDGLARIKTRDYLYLSGWAGTPFAGVHKRLTTEPGWRTHELPTGHSVIREAAEEFEQLLLLGE